MKTDMKAKLRRHEMCIGTHVSLNEAVVTEMMGYLPYDYLWIDMEHSVINTERLLGQLGVETALPEATAYLVVDGKRH